MLQSILSYDYSFCSKAREKTPTQGLKNFLFIFLVIFIYLRFEEYYSPNAFRQVTDRKNWKN